MTNAIQIEIKVNQDKGINMRKIEKNMMTAIENKKDFSSGNTRVNHFHRGNFLGSNQREQRTSINLHNNLIAIITDIKNDDWQRNDIELFNCGWETVTTKSRLNALLAHTPFKIVQRNFQWFIHSRMTDVMMPFYDGMKLPY